MRAQNEMLQKWGVLTDVAAERALQDQKWGQQDHDDGLWGLILGEEFGEVCRAALESPRNDPAQTKLRDELIQVAAVAASWVECIDRRRS